MANSRPIKTPGPDHPISIAPSGKHIVVSAGGQIIADTKNALTLQEASYPAVYYIPRADVNTALLAPSSHQTYCPYKGDCSYYSIAPGGDRSINAIWTYEQPHASVAQIAGYMAFYPDRVEQISVE